MGIGCSHHIGSGPVYCRVYGESRRIDGTLALYNLTLMVHQNQVRGSHGSKVLAKRIDLKVIRPFWISRRDMPGDPFIKAIMRK